MLFQLSFALLLASCLAQTHPGFHNTGHIQWRDCTAYGNDAWVKITKFDITPDPIKLPGDMFVTIDGTIDHKLDASITLQILLEKQLVGRWTKVPCYTDEGSCNYDSICEYLDTFFHSPVCPAGLTANNIPCTCPFAPDHLRMNDQVFSITSISSWWMFVLNGHFHIKVEMKDKATQTLRGCLEAYLDFTH